jgi:hypothetical protein
MQIIRFVKVKIVVTLISGGLLTFLLLNNIQPKMDAQTKSGINKVSKADNVKEQSAPNYTIVGKDCSKEKVCFLNVYLEEKHFNKEDITDLVKTFRLFFLMI